MLSFLPTILIPQSKCASKLFSCRLIHPSSFFFFFKTEKWGHSICVVQFSFLINYRSTSFFNGWEVVHSLGVLMQYFLLIYILLVFHSKHCYTHRTLPFLWGRFLEAHSSSWKQRLILQRMERASTQVGDQLKCKPLYFLQVKYVFLML